MRLKLGWVWLACVLLAAIPSMAADVWVDGALGADNDACGATAGAACKTIQFAVDKAVSGTDAIKVVAGTYDECVDASLKALDFVAQSSSPNDTIIDGWGKCGGLNCSYSGTVRCLVDADCTGTCSAQNKCTNSGADCTTDAECAATCVPIAVSPAATIALGAGSSLVGFTVKNGGASGITLEGTGLIQGNVVTQNNAFGSDGGGIFVEATTAPVRAVPDPSRCWSDLALTCTTDQNCSVCDQDHSIPCTSSDQCGGGDCASLGPCLAIKDVTIQANVVRGNSASGFGGGLFAHGEAESNTGVRIAATGNTFDGNKSTGSGGGGVLAQSTSNGGMIEIQLSDNTLTTNEAAQNGGGIESHSLAYFPGGRSSVVITRNTISGNTAGGMGGGADAESGTDFAHPSYVYGSSSKDTSLITSNTVTGNTAAYGGGISSFVGAFTYSATYVTGATQSQTVGQNTVTGNTATSYGGGIDAFFVNFDLLNADTGSTSSLVLDTNTVSGNTANVGGGIFTRTFAEAPIAGITFRVTGSTIENNTATMGGGGAYLWGLTMLSGEAITTFDHDLVKGNAVSDPDNQSAVGGGLLVLGLNATGDPGTARFDLDYLTVAGNTTDTGGGAAEIESFTDVGSMVVNASNSIAANNTGYALGGPVPGQAGKFTGGGTGHLTINTSYSDEFGNSFGRVERSLENVVSVIGGIEADPLLDASGVPSVCSPTVDAGDPEADFSAEPQPNGSRVNMGHTGGSSSAVATLPDINGDRAVTGADIVELSVAFGTASTDPRFVAAADRDHDGDVDGDDLAFVATFYGTDCR